MRFEALSILTNGPEQWWFSLIPSSAVGTGTWSQVPQSLWGTPLPRPPSLPQPKEGRQERAFADWRMEDPTLNHTHHTNLLQVRG